MNNWKFKFSFFNNKDLKKKTSKNLIKDYCRDRVLYRDKVKCTNSGATTKPVEDAASLPSRAWSTTASTGIPEGEGGGGWSSPPMTSSPESTSARVIAESCVYFLLCVIERKFTALRAFYWYLSFASLFAVVIISADRALDNCEILYMRILL